MRRTTLSRTAAAGVALVLTGLTGTALAASATAYAPVQRTNIERAVPAGATLLPSGRLVSPHGTSFVQGDFPLGLALSPDGRLVVATGVGQGDGTKGSDYADFCRGGKRAPADGCYGDGRFSPQPTTAPDEGLFVTDLVSGARTQLRGPATSCAPATDPAKSAAFSCFEDGVVWSPDGTHVYAAGGGNDAVYDYAVSAATTAGGVPTVGPQPVKVTYLQEGNGLSSGSATYQSPNAGTAAARTKGMAVTPDGAYLLVTKEQSGSLDILRTADLSFVQRVALGPLNPAGANGSATYPYAVAVAGDGSAAYVTLQGAGVLATVPLSRAPVTGTLVAGAPVAVPVGANPTGIALSPGSGATPAGRTIVVTNANDDTVSVLSTATSTLAPAPVQTISVEARPGEQIGAVPNAVAFDGPDRMYIALAGDNALAVLDRGATGFTQSGLLPTGWYPTGVAVRPDGSVLALAAKGLGEGFDPAGGYDRRPARGGPQALDPGFYDANASPGLLSVLPAPTAGDLAAGTTEVRRNLAYASAADPARGDTVIPPSDAAAGVSAITHVVYIVRENRTYDQVFGDLATTRNDVDADPAFQSLAAATPNAHALAGRFASSDSFFSAGEASVQGHFWTAAANVDDYVEKSYRQYYSARSHQADEISAPTAFPKNCSIFQAAQQKAASDPTFTYTDFGEPVGAFNPQIPAGAGAALGLPTGTAAGTAPNPCAAIPAQVNLSSFSSFLGVDDRRFSAEFLTQSGLNPDGSQIATGAGSNAQLRNFSYVELPGDHTTGFASSLENHTPRAQVAENDAAVGSVISALSKSSYWPSTAVFVVEDDSQDGPDHVDGHRNILLVASPYTRQTSANTCYGGYVSHVHTDQTSVLHTIELMLGLPALSSYDQNAAPLYDVFQAGKTSPRDLTSQDLAPYEPTPSAPFVEEKIGDATAGNPQRQAALRAESAHLDLNALDRAGPLLEDVLWKSTRGGTPPAQLRAALARSGSAALASSAAPAREADDVTTARSRSDAEQAQATALTRFGRAAQAPPGGVDCTPTAAGGGVTPTPVVPESPVPVGLPIAAAMVGLAALGVDQVRRRRKVRL